MAVGGHNTWTDVYIRAFAEATGFTVVTFDHGLAGLGKTNHGARSPIVSLPVLRPRNSRNRRRQDFASELDLHSFRRRAFPIPLKAGQGLP